MNIKLQYKLNAYLAILVGIGLIIGETIRRYGEWGYWSRWMDDYIMGLSLIIPAILILKKKQIAPRLLIAGWAFNIGMLHGSFFHKLAPDASDFQTNIDKNFLIFLIGLAFFTSIVGLNWLLFLEKSEPNIQKQN